MEFFMSDHAPSSTSTPVSYHSDDVASPYSCGDILHDSFSCAPLDQDAPSALHHNHNTSDLPFDKLKEECAVFGIWSAKRDTHAASYIPLGLHALQHRGQEATGLISSDGIEFYRHKGPGLVSEVFSNKDLMKTLKGHIAIGHNRYATAGGQDFSNIQPLYADVDFGGLAVAHNGNITNALTHRKRMTKEGRIFQSTNDSEIILHLIAEEKGTLTERVIQSAKQLTGGYSLLIMGQNKLIGMKDPFGIRPLVLGKVPSQDLYVLASETVALDVIGAEIIKELESGEMVIIDETGIQYLFPFEKTSKRFCVFEFIYFSRPDSILDGSSVYDVRKSIGRHLAKENPVEADIVVPVPDSSVAHAIGYAQEAKIPLEYGIIRSHYIGRTFIQPTDEIRHLSVKLKHNVNTSLIKGKRVVLIDDSIVRGTTCKKIVEMVRAAGAKEIHLRIASPATKHPCFYGVDTPDQNKLMAHCYSLQEMVDILKVDSLHFISFESMYQSLEKHKPSDFCDACFSGNYPSPLIDKEIEDYTTSHLALK